MDRVWLEKSGPKSWMGAVIFDEDFICVKYRQTLHEHIIVNALNRGGLSSSGIPLLLQQQQNNNYYYWKLCKDSSSLPVKLYAIYGMQATACFPRPVLWVVRVCVRLVTYSCVYLLCYTAPQFSCKFYEDNKIYLIWSDLTTTTTTTTTTTAAAAVAAAST